MARQLSIEYEGAFYHMDNEGLTPTATDMLFTNLIFS